MSSFEISLIRTDSKQRIKYVDISVLNKQISFYNSIKFSSIKTSSETVTIKKVNKFFQEPTYKTYQFVNSYLSILCYEARLLQSIYDSFFTCYQISSLTASIGKQVKIKFGWINFRSKSYKINLALKKTKLVLKH